MPDQLLEQSPDWGWFTHGETGDALLRQNALNERDRLAGDDAIAFDLLNTRTGNGHPGTTTSDLQELRETPSGGRGSWSTTKVNRLLRKLERKGWRFDGSKPRPGDMGGKTSLIWWSFERFKVQMGKTLISRMRQLFKSRINTMFQREAC